MRDLFNPNAPEQSRLALSDPPKPRRQLIDQYRPSCLDELHGQESVVSSLRAFCTAPTSKAFIFHGPTGVGKTSAAFALCGELRVDLASNWYHVRSGTANAETVEKIIDDFRFAPWGKAEAWRVVLVDEADKCTPKAMQLWLSILECLPERTVVVFTTNHIESFDMRTLDRFRSFEFMADSIDGAQAAVDAVWRAETGGTDGPDVSRLPNVVIDGQVSIRRAIQSLEAVIRDGLVLLPEPPSPVFLETSDVDRGSETVHGPVAVSIVQHSEEECQDRMGSDDCAENVPLATGPMPEMSDDRTAQPACIGSNVELESDRRDVYSDGRTIPIVGDDCHCDVGGAWRISGRVIERDGVTLVRLEGGACVPLDSDWSVVGEGLDDGENRGSEVLDCHSRRDEPRRDDPEHLEPELVRSVVRDSQDEAKAVRNDLPGLCANPLSVRGHEAPAQEKTARSYAIDVLTPSAVFLAPITGGAPPHEFVIGGHRYSVEFIPGPEKTYRLSKQGNGGAVYDVTETASGVTCDCPDYQKRHAHLEGQSLCKHGKALVDMGLLVRRVPAPIIVPVPFVDPAPISDETAAEIAAIRSAIVDRIATGMDETTTYAMPDVRLTALGQRHVAERQDVELTTLAGFIEREALRYDLMDSDAGELIARTLRGLAADVRSHQATTAAEYDARISLQDQWLTEDKPHAGRR